MTLDHLVAAAGLPAIRDVRPLTDGSGLDNRLSLVTLRDGRRLLLRQPHSGEHPNPAVSAAFLERQRVGAPRLYATAADGTCLVEWIPGISLADYLASAEVGSASRQRVWRLLGVALAAVHAVTFPPPPQGPVGWTGPVPRPPDPVAALHESLGRGERWIHRERPGLAAVPGPLHRLIDLYAEEISAECPCLLHGDVNLDNFIVTDESIRPIDWDHPRVGYPLAELGALDEHAYLNGSVDGLPAEFWLGYGRAVAPPLLLLHRAVGCLGWLAGSDWGAWEVDTRVSQRSKEKLRRWRELLIRWADTLVGRLTDPTTGTGR